MAARVAKYWGYTPSEFGRLPNIYTLTLSQLYADDKLETAPLSIAVFHRFWEWVAKAFKR